MNQTSKFWWKSDQYNITSDFGVFTLLLPIKVLTSLCCTMFNLFFLDLSWFQVQKSTIFPFSSSASEENPDLAHWVPKSTLDRWPPKPVFVSQWSRIRIKLKNNFPHWKGLFTSKPWETWNEEKGIYDWNHGRHEIKKNMHLKFENLIL